MAVRRRPASPAPRDDETTRQLHRLARRWRVPPLDPATPQNVEWARAHIAREMAELAGRDLTEAEIRDLSLPRAMRQRIGDS